MIGEKSLLAGGGGAFRAISVSCTPVLSIA
jgi:hypothetical protein